MKIWQTIEFGIRALRLKAEATKPPHEIERVARTRLQHLIAHARANSAFWRNKLAIFNGDSFELADLPIANKTELMENFDSAVTVDDLRRDEVESFLDDESNFGKFFRDKYALSRTSGTQGRPLLV